MSYRIDSQRQQASSALPSSLLPRLIGAKLLVAKEAALSSIAPPENEPRLLQLRKVSIYAVESGSSAPSVCKLGF